MRYGSAREFIYFGVRALACPCLRRRQTALVPGIPIPAGTCLGPLSSSYALGAADVPDGNRSFCTAGFSRPSWPYRLLGALIIAAVWLASQARDAKFASWNLAFPLHASRETRQHVR